METGSEYKLIIRFKPDSSALQAVELSPSLTRVTDIIEAAFRKESDGHGEQLPFLLRELRARLLNHSVLAQHLHQLRTDYHATFTHPKTDGGISCGMTEVS